MHPLICNLQTHFAKEIWQQIAFEGIMFVIIFQ